MPNAKIKTTIIRDPDLRTLRMCVKYLSKVCSPRMVQPTLDYLNDRFEKKRTRATGDAD